MRFAVVSMSPPNPKTGIGLKVTDQRRAYLRAYQREWRKDNFDRYAEANRAYQRARWLKIKASPEMLAAHNLKKQLNRKKRIFPLPKEN